MKIRIKGNSVRLRLSKTDLALLEQNKAIEEETNFGETVFYYVLQPSTVHLQLDAAFAHQTMTIFIPGGFANVWNNNNIISIDVKKEIGIGKSLYLLVEKDFQCLDKTSEDQSDFFTNPNKTCA